MARHKAKVDDTYERWGKRVDKIESDLSGSVVGSRYWTLLFDGLRHVPLDPSTVDLLRTAFETSLRQMALERAIDEIRNYASEDRTEPIAVRFVGRALVELGARDEATAKSRIQIFAKFDEDPAKKVLEAPGSVDYQKVAQECARYVAALGKAGSKGKPASRVHANDASRALEKPVERLELLRLADARLDVRGKRQASYLKGIATRVFDEWPEWDDK